MSKMLKVNPVLHRALDNNIWKRIKERDLE